jgi:hypothetical protein
LPASIVGTLPGPGVNFPASIVTTGTAAGEAPARCQVNDDQLARRSMQKPGEGSEVDSATGKRLPTPLRRPNTCP